MILEKAKDFDIEDILECGQCFRFKKLGEKHYAIIAHGRLLFVEQNDTEVKLNCSDEDFDNIWSSYFDLGRDYGGIKDILSQDDEVLAEAINFAPGIRLLNQDPYECLISFIISQNNRIPMIKKVIENLSTAYGDLIESDYYSFPDSNRLNLYSIEELMAHKMGFRAKYIKDALAKIESKDIIIEDIFQLDTIQARKKLMTIYGVGQKVADCVLLMSFKKYDVFPTDVWVKRVMEYFYFDGKTVSMGAIQEFAKGQWGELSGFAQQYLFHYARVNQDVSKIIK